MTSGEYQYDYDYSYIDDDDDDDDDDDNHICEQSPLQSRYTHFLLKYLLQLYCDHRVLIWMRMMAAVVVVAVVAALGICLGGGICFAIRQRTRRNNVAYTMLKNFTHLQRLPLIGSLHLVAGNMRVRVEKALKLMTMITENSPIVFWFSYVPIVVLATSEQIQMVSNKIQDRFVMGIFENVLQDGILLAQGEQWKTIRRIMNPAFSGALLLRYMVVFNEQAAILVQQLAERGRLNTGIEIDLWQYISDMNFDTVTENMTDYKLHVQEKGGNEFTEAVKDALYLESQRLNNPMLFLDAFFTIYKYLTGKNNLYKKINELPTKIVRQKMEEYESEKRTGAGDGAGDGDGDGDGDNGYTYTKEKPMRSLVDFLLRVHDTYPQFDENRMRIEILNMIFAGSDTTATTVSLALLFLAIHPEIQEKVYCEIQQVFDGDLSANVQMHHCVKLKYTEQCIKETLRRFSLVPLTARRCTTEAIKINDQQIIPANCMVAFAYHAVHQNPTVYANPDNFDPDRFLPQNMAEKNDFMGFGTGPRACIGAKYAMLSMKTQIVHILRKYRLSTDITVPDIIPIVDMLSRSQNGYPVKIWSRETAEQTSSFPSS